MKPPRQRTTPLTGDLTEPSCSPDDGREDEAAEADPRDGQAERDGAPLLKVLADDHHCRDVGQPQTDACTAGTERTCHMWPGTRVTLALMGVGGGVLRSFLRFFEDSG